MESIKELRKICQEKGYKEHDAIRLYRLFSIYFTKLALIFHIGPNLATSISFLLALIGGVFYIRGDLLLGSFLFFMFYVFDNVDGEIARYRKLTSDFGYWIDTTVGHIIYPYFFVTLGFGMFEAAGTWIYFILGVAAGMAKLLERSVPKIPPKGMDGETQKADTSQEGFSPKEWMSYLGKFPVVLLAALVFSLFGLMGWFLWVYAIYLSYLAIGKFIIVGFRVYKKEQTYN